MEIKVLGGGCSSCSQMYDNARIAVDELGLDLEVEFIHDITKALQYEVLQMPALIIDERPYPSAATCRWTKSRKY